MNNHCNAIKLEHNGEADDEDMFYFESDHLALRGNFDYSEVLKTMFVLEAQRNQVLQDFNKLVELKKECLEDPLSYFDKCQNRTLDIPPLQNIAEIPQINWSKYSANVPEQFMRQINLTRMQPKQNIRQPEKKTKTWTIEEQRKLEELLIKYPPEEVENKRIVKIANELGTRTKEQVASRLQKYYLKLLEAGLPVPGRLPKSGSKFLDRRKNAFKKSSNPGHYHRKYLKPSTFFPDTIIPVVMDEFYTLPGPSTSNIIDNGNISVSDTGGAQDELTKGNYLLSTDYHVAKQPKAKKYDADIEMDLLKWVKAEKIIESKSSLYQHYGYKCDFCDAEPIQGSRWHCTTCINDSIDFCTDCIISQFYSNSSHNSHHTFLVIRNEKEVTSGPWNESESDSDSINSNDYTDNEQNDEEQFNDSPSISGSANDNENDSISTISEQCPNDIFDSKLTNGRIEYS